MISDGPCASVRLDELFGGLPSWDASCSGKHRIATAAQTLHDRLAILWVPCDEGPINVGSFGLPRS